jgi:hypothetical protein
MESNTKQKVLPANYSFQCDFVYILLVLSSSDIPSVTSGTCTQEKQQNMKHESNSLHIFEMTTYRNTQHIWKRVHEFVKTYSLDLLEVLL